MNRKKYIAILYLLLMTGMVRFSNCYAPIGDEYVVLMQKGEEEIKADRIITKYRRHMGRRQYRRWNETKKKWIDPEWIDCKEAI